MATFSIYPKLIYETVKNKTHVTAHVLRASDKNASEVAFHQEIGDEAFHDRMLERELYAGIDKIKAEIIGYLDVASSSTSTNISTQVNDDSITFSLELNSRYNTAYLKPLADLVSEYIEDFILYKWWSNAGNQNMKQTYFEQMNGDLASILKCFIKSAPKAETQSYANISATTTSNTSSSTSGSSSTE